MKPLYTHDCNACVFLGTWRKNPDCDTQQDFDLYVCETFTNLPSTNCVARFGSDGPDYASMTLENSVWDESLAAHDAGKERPSMYLCWMPELLECWRRAKMRTFHPNPDYSQKARESSEEAEILRTHVGLSHVIHDEAHFDMPVQSMESDEARKAVLELRLLVADGYTFKVNADGSVGDGDLSWPSLQAFLDSRKPSISPLQDKVDERVRRIATVRRALLAAANLSRKESRDMTTQEVADDVLNQLTEGEFDAEH